MIPAFNHSGVLPPFLPGQSPITPTAVSPYETDMATMVSRFAITGKRVALLNGLLQYRQALLGLGIASGFQWIDGSFVEDIETTETRDPGDIDLVTFAYLPAAISAAQLLSSHQPIFDPDMAKARYGCHAFFVNLGAPSVSVHEGTCYWLSLFSHKRVTSVWKGLLRVDLRSNDVQAAGLIGKAP